MSFTGGAYDPCNYSLSLRESLGPGMYKMMTPLPLPDACDGRQRTDAGSTLRGLDYKLDRCGPAYVPGGDVRDACGLPADVARLRDQLLVEETRVSNPPSTLRGQGVNRWSPLCEQPQCHAISPFHISSNDRMQAKDGYRPCATVPLDPAASLPPPAPDAVAPPVLEYVHDEPILPDVYGVQRPVGGW